MTVVNGDSGNNTLHVSAGDLAMGRQGDDTYVVDGILSTTESATVADYGGRNRIRFQNGITLDNIAIGQEPNVDTEGFGFFVQGGNPIGTGSDYSPVTGRLYIDGAIAEYEFADGTVITHAELLNLAMSSRLLIVGHGMLIGGRGNDRLIGGRGADTLDGGRGDDVLVGREGADTYRFGRGSGRDLVVAWDLRTESKNIAWVEMKAGVTSGDLVFARNGDNLVIAIAGTPDTLTIYGHYLPWDAQALTGGIAGIRFADGTTIDEVGIKSLLGSTAGDDIISGDDAANLLRGLAGNDTLLGGDGNDTLLGGDGNDTLIGGSGADTLGGNLGNDLLYGQDGSDNILGGDGSDQLWGDDGNDTLNGGAGADELDGGIGDDLLLDHEGNNTLTGGAGNDRLEVMASTFSTLRGGLGNDTYRIIGTTSSGKPSGAAAKAIENAGDGYDTVEIVDLASYVLPENIERLNVVSHSGAATVVAGNSLDNVIIDSDGRAGSGTAIALLGGAGNDTLNGMGGNDTLVGGVGDDTYLFGRGSGVDSIQENDLTSGNLDVLALGPDVALDQLWFRRVGSDLELSIIGTSDKAIVSNWYLGSRCHVELIKTSDGKAMLHSQVDALVSAMAGFAPPASGHTTFLASHQSALTPVMGANWP